MSNIDDVKKFYKVLSEIEEAGGKLKRYAIGDKSCIP